MPYSEEYIESCRKMLANATRELDCAQQWKQENIDSMVEEVRESIEEQDFDEERIRKLCEDISKAQYYIEYWSMRIKEEKCHINNVLDHNARWEDIEAGFQEVI